MASKHEIFQQAVLESRVEPERVRMLNQSAPCKEAGAYVLYWCTRAPRTVHNEALEVAKSIARLACLPLVCLSVLDLEEAREGSLRHVLFQLEGLIDFTKSLVRRHGVSPAAVHVRLDPALSVVTRAGAAAGTSSRSAASRDSYLESGEAASSSTTIVGGLSVLGGAAPVLIRGPAKASTQQINTFEGFALRAFAIVTERGHLRYQRTRAARVAALAGRPVLEVETSLIVPVETASVREEMVASSFLTRLGSGLGDRYLHELRPSAPIEPTPPELVAGLHMLGYAPAPEVDRGWSAEDWLATANRSHLLQVLRRNGVDCDAPTISASAYRGGENAARRLLSVFVARKLYGYAVKAEHQNEALRAEYGSLLSPYLTFGHISPVYVAIKVHRAAAERAIDEHGGRLRACDRAERVIDSLEKHAGDEGGDSGESFPSQTGTASPGFTSEDALLHGSGSSLPSTSSSSRRPASLSESLSLSAAIEIASQQVDVRKFMENMYRRELAYNFVMYNKRYDTFEGAVPAWARRSLFERASRRTSHYQYSEADWYNARTHDARWNAVQRELLTRGRNMCRDRNYWCQKILEYENDPAHAFELSVRINNHLMLDANDPVGYATCAQCFGRWQQPVMRPGALGSLERGSAPEAAFGEQLGLVPELYTLRTEEQWRAAEALAESIDQRLAIVPIPENDTIDAY
ncbi:hypothetical protein CCYA_CCYA02G0781 [Cyanidiococcus yangmingshanensis]|nr:hypothetical protein CCYA_CCYA02G0781 [Cyanidiococcus yangmingshanensis]